MPTEAAVEEIWKILRETDLILKENALLQQDTDRRMKETDRQMQETDRRMKETDRKLDRLAEQIGDLTGKWGRFVEGLVAPACETLFAERGIPVHQVFPRVRVRKGGRTMEIDLLVVNEGHAVLVECKSTLKVQDVRDHIARLAEFKSFFPRYADCIVLGAVAGMVIEEAADVFAAREGLFVLAQAGDTVRLLNRDGFAPRAW